MAFQSLAFLAFAAIVLLLYFSVPKRLQWGVLLLAGCGFYLFADLRYFIFLLYTAVINYAVARLIQKRADDEDDFIESVRDTLERSERKAIRAAGKRIRFRILVLGLILSLGMLAVLKYFSFLQTGVNRVFLLLGDREIRPGDIWLPLGISFYTFQSVGYLIDVYRKKVRSERNFGKFLLFVSFFPQVVQGPISRFGDLNDQLTAPHSLDRAGFSAGLLRVTWGYFKKMVVADTAMIAVRTLVSDPAGYRGVYVFLLILLYSVEIYADFTGGMDITIGFSEMLGIRLTENFDRPFASRSVKEYWRRWHITMGSWFTDYVFYPLSVCVPMQKFSKWAREHLGNGLGKRLPVYFATIVTWFLTGIWHGVGANFIVWGLLNCFAILLSQELNPLWIRFGKRFPKLTESGGWGCFRAVRTFLLMGLFRSLDCYRNVPLTFRLWGSMLTEWNVAALFRGGMTSFGLGIPEWGVLCAGVAIMTAVSRAKGKEPLRYRLARRPVLLCGCLCVLAIAVLLFGAYGIGFDASDFIYGQF